MATEKKPALTYPDAITEYYGGVHDLAKASLPFTCKQCKGQKYKDIKLGAEFFVMKVEECYKHIRSMHRERIKA